MKNFLISIIFVLFMTSPLFGQSDNEKRFAFRTALVAHALTYNLDKQNGIGFHFGHFSTGINENNIDTIEKTFF